MKTSGNDFYEALPAFSRFSEVTDAARYRPAPSDWLCIVADIEGSTAAIAEGRYKAVNMVGAAVITSILNACPDLDLPYVFGGDGATLLCPPQAGERVSEVLRKTQSWARQAFALSLRVGIVPLRVLIGEGAEVRVSKYEMTPGNFLAMFSGHGVELADRLVKQENSPYRLPDSDGAAAPDLEGLSCRWEPLESNRGTMLTLLVHARPDADGAQEQAIYRKVMTGIGEILDGEGQGAPVSLKNLAFRWPPKGFWYEVKAGVSRGRLKAFLGATFITLIAWWLNRTDKPLGNFDPARYRDEVRAQSDFRKFDDMLRMVVDCSFGEAGAIEAFLDSEQQAGRLCYGLHRSEEALMTCLVFSLDESRHVHFIDGAGGGYALAARDLKGRLAEMLSPA